MPARLTLEERRLREIAETPFQHQILDLAKLCGWTHRYHAMTSQKNGAFLTAVTSRGFPDLFMLRETGDGHVEIVVWEVKREIGKTTPEQDRWLALLSAAGLEARVVRPSDWDYISERLKR